MSKPADRDVLEMQRVLQRHHRNLSMTDKDRYLHVPNPGDITWRANLRTQYELATGRSFRTGAIIKEPGVRLRAVRPTHTQKNPAAMEDRRAGYVNPPRRGRPPKPR